MSEIITLQAQVDIPDSRALVSTEIHSKLFAELLAERFGIGVYQERVTLNIIYQIGMRLAVLPLSIRYKAYQY